MLRSEWSYLEHRIPIARGVTAGHLYGLNASVSLADRIGSSVLGSRANEVAGRSLVLITSDQLATALAFIELDGLASRVVLYPPDLSLELLSYVVGVAHADGIVTDCSNIQQGCCVATPVLHLKADAVLKQREPNVQRETEWVLLTSGTTGLPKLVVHTLASLTGALEPASSPRGDIVWSTFYDIRRYGGLQILLRSLLLGASMVLSSADEAPTDFLQRAGSLGVTHISGTPSHWRKALMSPAAGRIEPSYIRLSGEIADQGILNHLRSVYPLAKISHAFASTEAGVAFEVEDGLAGFPAGLLEKTPGLDLKVEYGSLRVRSNRTASRYLGNQGGTLMDEDGFVDTSDMLELRDGRYHFTGRRDGVINVGGAKVHPEEVEAVINQHARVHMSLVRAKKNAITGSLVIADVVLKAAPGTGDAEYSDLQRDILRHCRAMLAPYKVPALIHFVASLQVAESGKLERRHA